MDCKPSRDLGQRWNAAEVHFQGLLLLKFWNGSKGAMALVNGADRDTVPSRGRNGFRWDTSGKKPNDPVGRLPVPLFAKPLFLLNR